MASVIQLEDICKSFSAEPLLENITCSIQAGDRLGLIGPNGAGKSTLLKIMADLEQADTGIVRSQKGAQILYTSQAVPFSKEQSVSAVLANAWQCELEVHERDARCDRLLREIDVDPNENIGALSGGWQKRVQLVSGLMQEPALWLLDEPTNHLDLAAVLWLQHHLRHFRGTLVLISHDRYFLNEVCTRIIDVNRCYVNGILDTQGNYDDYLVARDAYVAAQQKEQNSLANRHRREQEWLARRPKARTTKSVSRVKRAADIADDLKKVQERNTQRSMSGVGFHGSARRAKDLIVAEQIAAAFDDLSVFDQCDVHLSAGDRLILLGANGSGKSTLMKCLAQDLPIRSGTIKHAHELRIVQFSQDRSQLDQSASLKQVLCPEGDTVYYHGRPMHINAWLQLFLFSPDQLDQTINVFSGGEQARILLSQMMLKEADVLCLDEPTNDLDIPSIELLEQSLIEFEGSVILITHDRYLMESVATHFLAMELGSVPTRVGSYRQWEDQRGAQKNLEKKTDVAADSASSLSWDEQKELRGMEKRIQKAEARLEELAEKLNSNDVAGDAKRYAEVSADYDTCKQQVEDLYTRWQLLEERSL